MFSKHALDLVKVTEQAAISAADFIGRGDKNAADQAGVDAMRKMLGKMDIRGRVVIGEGEIDEAPMLYIGEELGSGNEDSLEVDIAVDPVEGTNLVARGENGSIAVLALAPRGGFLHAPDMYMDKIAGGPDSVGVIGLEKSVEENIRDLARAKGKDPSQIKIAVLDRPRHEDLVKEIRDSGARVMLYSDGDVETAISTCFMDSDIDMIMGIGGAPEGVLAAAAIKAMGGSFQGRLAPSNDSEIERCHLMGIEDVDHIFDIGELVKSHECIFVASGITKGSFLQGVNIIEGIAETSSVIIDSIDGVSFINSSTYMVGNKDDK